MAQAGSGGYPENSHTPRNWGVARVLAPVALILVLLAVYVVASGSLGIDDGSGEETAISTSDGKEGGDGDGAENPKTYVVVSGDVLSSIAEKFDVSVERLERLNPEIDPQTLNAGVVIKIR